MVADEHGRDQAGAADEGSKVGVDGAGSHQWPGWYCDI
jgi:hypothetical protein